MINNHDQQVLDYFNRQVTQFYQDEMLHHYSPHDLSISIEKDRANTFTKASTDMLIDSLTQPRVYHSPLYSLSHTVSIGIDEPLFLTPFNNEPQLQISLLELLLGSQQLQKKFKDLQTSWLDGELSINTDHLPDYTLIDIEPFYQHDFNLRYYRKLMLHYNNQLLIASDSNINFNLFDYSMNDLIRRNYNLSYKMLYSQLIALDFLKSFLMEPSKPLAPINKDGLN